jgi:hypothetical protein
VHAQLRPGACIHTWAAMHASVPNFDTADVMCRTFVLVGFAAGILISGIIIWGSDSPPAVRARDAHRIATAHCRLTDRSMLPGDLIVQSADFNACRRAHRMAAVQRR